MQIALVIFFCIYSGISYGYSSERSLSNLSSDLSTCAAYYLFMSNGLEASSSDGTQMKKLGALTFESAVIFSNKDVTKSRVKLSYQQLVKETGNNFSNAAIVIDKYGQTCKSIIEDPEARLNYWLERSVNNDELS